MPAPHKIPWWTVRALDAAGAEHVFYGGPDREAARRVLVQAGGLAGYAGLRLSQDRVYPPPDRHPGCRCRGDARRQCLCPFGHPDGCHYPLTCARADCGHRGADHPDLVTATDAERVAGWLAAAVAPGDLLFPDGALPAGVRCSRCGRPISGDGDLVVYQDAALALVGSCLRYHRACLGLPETP